MGKGARVIRFRRLVGGVVSPVHGLVIESRHGHRHHLVLRRWKSNQNKGSRATAEIIRESETLSRLSATDLPVPRLVATDPTGEHTGGDPAILMTRIPGHIHLSPRDPDDWLRQTAAILPRIHSANIEAPPYKSWLNLEALEVPPWSRNPMMWRRAIEVVRDGPVSHESCFVHRDFQHFNLLWSREKLTGVVDWVWSSKGSPDVDVSHCRLNLSILFSPEWAERFRSAYESEAGRSVDPWWDVAGILVYLPGWDSFVQVQAGSRAKVDLRGMHGRVDELLEVALGKF